MVIFYRLCSRSLDAWNGEAPSVVLRGAMISPCCVVRWLVCYCAHTAPRPQCSRKQQAGDELVGGRLQVLGNAEGSGAESKGQGVSETWRAAVGGAGVRSVLPSLVRLPRTRERPLEILSPDTLPFLALKSHIVHLASCFAGVFTLPKRYSRRARLGILVELLTVESSFSPRALTLTPYSSTASLFKALESVWQLATFCSYCLCVCVREGKCFVDENRVRF